MSSPETGWALCIDFGTAFSKAAAAPVGAWKNFDPAKVRPLMLGAGGDGNPFLLPSAVFVDQDRLLFGARAVARMEEIGGDKRQALRSFKTLLSAGDLARALDLFPPASIDPHRLFRQRHLIVLYFAYLLWSIDRAVALDPDLVAVRGFQMRFACPAWRAEGETALHAIIAGLLDEARVVRNLLGDTLGSVAGVPLNAATDALEKGASALGTPMPAMGMIYEATAAVAYSSIGLKNPAAHLMVVDMGAGTTDIAALSRDGAGYADLPKARITLNQAGDVIDRVLLNIAIERARALKTDAEKGRLWRSLMGSIREVKETLFVEKRAAIRHDGRAIMIKLSDLEGDRSYKRLVKDITDAYHRAVKAMAAEAGDARDVQVMAVGGGSGAPFIQAMIRRKPPTAGKLKITPRPATPDWAHSAAFGGNLAPVFPQLAIAIGGALAPDDLLAIRR